MNFNYYGLVSASFKEKPWYFKTRLPWGDYQQEGWFIFRISYLIDGIDEDPWEI